MNVHEGWTVTYAKVVGNPKPGLGLLCAQKKETGKLSVFCVDGSIAAT